MEVVAAVWQYKMYFQMSCHNSTSHCKNESKQRQNVHLAVVAIFMNNAATASPSLRSYLRLPFSQNTQSHKLPANNSEHKNTAGEAATISFHNKLSSLTTGAKSKVTTRIQLYCRTSLPGWTGLAIVIGVQHTHKHTDTHACTHTQQAPRQDQYLLGLHLVPTM